MKVLSDGNFAPANKLTREQVLSVTLQTLNTFKDNPIQYYKMTRGTIRLIWTNWREWLPNFQAATRRVIFGIFSAVTGRV